MMTRGAKRGITAAVALAVIVFFVLNLLAYNHVYGMMHYSAGGLRTSKPEDLSFRAKVKVIFTGANIPKPVSSRPPSDLAADCRVLSIGVGSNVTLSAWYCDRGRDTPLVVMFHGYAAEKTSLVHDGRELLDLGASVLLVDFRGSGGSSESYSTIGVHEADDVAAVFRYAKAGLPHPAVVLFGKSMGAAAILRAVKVHGISPDAVIIEAVFDTMLNTVCNRFKTVGIPSFPAAQLMVFWGGVQWGFNGFEHNPVDYARAVTCPALFMHGSLDVRATVADSRRVFDAVPGAKEYKEFKGAGHDSYSSISPDEWRAAVKKVLGIVAGKAVPPVRPVERTGSEQPDLEMYRNEDKNDT